MIPFPRAAALSVLVCASAAQSESEYLLQYGGDANLTSILGDDADPQLQPCLPQSALDGRTRRLYGATGCTSAGFASEAGCGLAPPPSWLPDSQNENNQWCGSQSTEALCEESYVQATIIDVNYGADKALGVWNPATYDFSSCLGGCALCGWDGTEGRQATGGSATF